MARRALVTQISLEGSRVRLRPLLEKDFSLLLQWRNDPLNLILWSGVRTIIPESEYIEELRNDYKEGTYRLCIEEKDTGELIGHIFAYGYSAQNNHAYVGLYIRPEKQDLYFGIADKYPVSTTLTG